MEVIQFKEIRPINLDGIAKDKYEADNFGNIYSNGKIIYPSIINSGYLKYSLITGEKHPKYKNILAHRLIKMVFDPIDNPDEYTVNHINMDFRDCSDHNLEWVSQKENNDKKYKVFPNDGINNYRATFNYSELEIIVHGIDNNIPYKKILEEIGMEATDNNCDYIGNIKRGITYKSEVEQIRRKKFND